MSEPEKKSAWTIIEKVGKIFGFLTIIGIGFGILIKYGGDKEAEKNCPKGNENG